MRLRLASTIHRGIHILTRLPVLGRHSLASHAPPAHPLVSTLASSPLLTPYRAYVAWGTSKCLTLRMCLAGACACGAVTGRHLRLPALASTLSCRLLPASLPAGTCVCLPPAARLLLPSDGFTLLPYAGYPFWSRCLGVCLPYELPRGQQESLPMQEELLLPC